MGQSIAAFVWKWSWRFVAAVCLAAFAKATLSFLDSVGLHPDLWMLRLMGFAVTPSGLNNAAWLMAAALAVIAVFAWEIFDLTAILRRKLAVNPAPPQSEQPPRIAQSQRRLSELSNAEIKRQARALIVAIRTFAINFQNEEGRLMIMATSNAMTPEQRTQAEHRYRDGMMQRHVDMRTQYYRQYATTAVALYDELLRRSGIFQRPSSSIQTMIFNSPEHFAGGATVVFTGMNTLEALVDGLPD